jgi:hypothetical protein
VIPGPPQTPENSLRGVPFNLGSFNNSEDCSEISEQNYSNIKRRDKKIRTKISMGKSPKAKIMALPNGLTGDLDEDLTDFFRKESKNTTKSLGFEQSTQISTQNNSKLKLKTYKAVKTESIPEIGEEFSNLKQESVQDFSKNHMFRNSEGFTSSLRPSLMNT